MSIDPAELLTILSIIGVVVGVLLWVVDSRINKVLLELKPNGGQSTRDAIDRIERRMESHMEWHMGGKP